MKPFSCMYSRAEATATKILRTVCSGTLPYSCYKRLKALLSKIESTLYYNFLKAKTHIHCLQRFPP